MNTTPTHCAKCGGGLEAGFIPDFNHGQSQSRPGAWVEGEPKRSFWFGTSLRGRQRHQITAFRCRSCGYLELYANKA